MGLAEVKLSVEKEIASIASEISELNVLAAGDDIPTWRLTSMKDRMKYLEGRRSLAMELVEKIEKMEKEK